MLTHPAPQRMNPGDPLIVAVTEFAPWPFRDALVALNLTIGVIDDDGTVKFDRGYVLSNTKGAEYTLLVEFDDGRFAVATREHVETYCRIRSWQPWSWKEHS